MIEGCRAVGRAASGANPGVIAVIMATLTRTAAAGTGTSAAVRVVPEVLVAQVAWVVREALVAQVPALPNTAAVGLHVVDRPTEAGTNPS